MRGQKIGQYELLERIGKGGMGIVYLARQVSLGRNVALKLLSPEVSENPHTLNRFLREAKAAATVGDGASDGRQRRGCCGAHTRGCRGC